MNRLWIEVMGLDPGRLVLFLNGFPSSIGRAGIEHYQQSDKQESFHGR